MQMRFLGIRCSVVIYDSIDTICTVVHPTMSDKNKKIPAAFQSLKGTLQTQSYIRNENLLTI